MTQALPLHISIFHRILMFLMLLTGGQAAGGGSCRREEGRYGGVGMPEEERTFLDVIDRYGSVIGRICRSFATVVEEEADLRQDVLINIWKGMASFRAEADMKTWIYRVTMNTCVSSQRRRPKGEAIRLDTLPTPDSLPGKDDKERATRNQSAYENSQWLQAMLNSLSLDDHAIMAMWLDDLPYDEIAALMGMNRNTVATRVRRAKERLREAVESGRI